MRRSFSLAAISLLTLANAAYAADMDMNATSPEAKAEEAAMEKMDQGMMQPYTNDADKDFVRGMIPHHEGAVDMAKVELQYGTDPKIRELAKGIIDSQEEQIGMMKGWLAKHDQPPH